MNNDIEKEITTLLVDIIKNPQDYTSSEIYETELSVSTDHVRLTAWNDDFRRNYVAEWKKGTWEVEVLEIGMPEFITRSYAEFFLLKDIVNSMKKKDNSQDQLTMTNIEQQMVILLSSFYYNPEIYTVSSSYETNIVCEENYLRIQVWNDHIGRTYELKFRVGNWEFTLSKETNDGKQLVITSNYTEMLLLKDIMRSMEVEPQLDETESELVEDTTEKERQDTTVEITTLDGRKYHKNIGDGDLTNLSQASWYGCYEAHDLFRHGRHLKTEVSKKRSIVFKHAVSSITEI